MTIFWWIVKILCGIFIFNIVVGFLVTIYQNITSKKAWDKYKSIKNANIENAFEYLTKNKSKFTGSKNKYKEYEEELINLADHRNVSKAVTELYKYYISRAEDCERRANDPEHKDIREQSIRAAADYRAKSIEWKKRMALEGDIDSIIEFYFEGYNLKPGTANIVLPALKKVKTYNEKTESLKTLLTGIVYYAIDDIPKAKEMFVINADKYLEHKLRLIKCYEHEGNLVEVERKLNEIAENSNDFNTDAIKTDAFSKEVFGKSYNSIGNACYNGNNGFEKDVKKAYENYQKALEFGYLEDMLPFGLFHLMGEIDGVTFKRDYFKANEYIYKAAQNGNSEANEYLEKYGVDGVIIFPPKKSTATYKFTDGYELTASAETIAWLHLHYGIRYKAMVIADTFMEDYTKQFTSFKEMMDGIYPLYGEYVAQMFRWGINLLMKCGIDSYDANEILNRCDGDISLLNHIPKFEQGLEAIDNRAAKLNLEVAYAQATRGKWVGGGFGTTVGGAISGAIKGSIAAGAMNLGSGILHGIGDSIGKAINNSEIKGMENKLFSNPNTKIEFCNAVLISCSMIGDAIMEIMEENSNICLEPLGGEVIYDRENLADLEDNVLAAKINNNLSAENFEYVYILLIESLRRQPLDQDVLKMMYKITFKRVMKPPQENAKDLNVLERYRGDFGLKGL